MKAGDGVVGSGFESQLDALRVGRTDAATSAFPYSAPMTKDVQYSQFNAATA